MCLPFPSLTKTKHKTPWGIHNIPRLTQPCIHDDFNLPLGGCLDPWRLLTHLETFAFRLQEDLELMATVIFPGLERQALVWNVPLFRLRRLGQVWVGLWYTNGRNYMILYEWYENETWYYNKLYDFHKKTGLHNTRMIATYLLTLTKAHTHSSYYPLTLAEHYLPMSYRPKHPKTPQKKRSGAES